MATSSTWVLKFPQVDKPDQPILVHVTQRPDTTLDLDLLATDGEEAFKGKVRARSLNKLQAENYDGTESQWTALLRHTLISHQDPGVPDDQARILEADCTVSGRGARAVLSITLRSRIEDITHRLGAIELGYSENTDDIDLFGWSCRLADQRDQLDAQVTSYRQEARAARAAVAALETQLADLVAAKGEHEDQLLSKFALLLNEKKLKIRNQERVLQTARIDPKKLRELQLTLGGERDGGSTSKSKRHRGLIAPDRGSEDDESDAFEAMDVDPQPGADEQAQDPGTPERSDTETATEDEADLDVPGGSRLAGKAVAPRRPSPPPPRRALPFQKKSSSTAAARRSEPPRPSTVDDDEETASEDDEL